MCSSDLQLCENMGRGLVAWDIASKYEDLKELSNQAAFWTALTNTNGVDCDGASACDGLLVRQLKSLPKMNQPHNFPVPVVMAANFWWSNSNVLLHLPVR